MDRGSCVPASAADKTRVRGIGVRRVHRFTRRSHVSGCFTPPLAPLKGRRLKGKPSADADPVWRGLTSRRTRKKRSRVLNPAAGFDTLPGCVKIDPGVLLGVRFCGSSKFQFYVTLLCGCCGDSPIRDARQQVETCVRKERP